MRNLLTFGMVALFSILLPACSSRPRSGSQTACLSQVKNIATALEMYRSDHDARLPSSTAELEPNYIRSIQDMHCDFDPKGKGSYVYYPPGQERYHKEQGLLVIVGCRARHPDVLYSADGDRDTPRHLLVGSDLSTRVVEGAQIELTDPPSR